MAYNCMYAIMYSIHVYSVRICTAESERMTYFEKSSSTHSPGKDAKHGDRNYGLDQEYIPQCFSRPAEPHVQIADFRNANFVHVSVRFSCSHGTDYAGHYSVPRGLKYE